MGSRKITKTPVNPFIVIIFGDEDQNFSGQRRTYTRYPKTLIDKIKRSIIQSLIGIFIPLNANGMPIADEFGYGFLID
jgi:hypothetical protein